MSSMDDYYKQLQTLNQQRGVTGNAQQGKGMDASLAEGYMDSQMKNQMAEKQYGLQQKQLGLQKQGQAFNQANTLQQNQQAKSNQTTSLIGQAVGGAANLGMQAYGMSQKSDLINKMFPQQVSDTTEQLASNAEFMKNYGLDQSSESAGFLSNTLSGAKDYLNTGLDWLTSIGQNIGDLF